MGMGANCTHGDTGGTTSGSMVVGRDGRSSLTGSTLQHPPDPETAAQALRAKTTLTAIAGEGIMDIALLNVEHGIMVIEDLVLQQTWVQETSRL